MEKLQQEILEDLRIELGLTRESDVAILFSKIRNAYRELALYDFNQCGAEGQISHSENGVSRAWKDRKECLNGIVTFCGVL